MDKITVFRWRKYDISSDESRISRRYATREAVGRHNGVVIEGTGVDVEVFHVGGEVEGMTVRDFNPNPRTGFQTQVLR